MRADPRRALVRWLPVLVYFTVTSLGHLEFSLWLVRSRESAWLGRYAWKDAVPMAVVAGALALAIWVLRTLLRDPQGRGRLLSFWLGWLLCVVLVDRFLTYSLNEYAHYPQYGLMAWLVAWALDPDRRIHCPGRVLFWATLLGMVDETMQYLWIASTYGNYLDFNDFLVNLLAATAGVALYYRGRLARTRPWAWAPLETLVAACLVAGATLGITGDVLRVSPGPGHPVPTGAWSRASEGGPRMYLQRAPFWYGSWQASTRHAVYRVLSPGEGMLLLCVGAALFVVASVPAAGLRSVGGANEGTAYGADVR